MAGTSQQLQAQAPRVGPWIIGYCAALIAAFAINGFALTDNAVVRGLLWVPILLCVVMIIVNSWRRNRLLGTVSPAVRRFWRHFVIASAVMFGGYCLVALIEFGLVPITEARAWLLVPQLGFAGMIWAIHDYVTHEEDEFLRSQSLRQIWIASYVTFIAVIGWTALAILLRVPPGQLSMVILIWFAGLGIGRMVIEMRA